MGYAIGAILFVAWFSFIFLPSALEMASQTHKKFQARKKRGYPEVPPLPESGPDAHPDYVPDHF